LLARAEALAEEGTAQWDAFMQADRDIHLALARLAGNPLHGFFLETVHTNLHRYHIRAYLPRDEETIRTTLAELKAIVQAVSRGEAERAEALAREHVRRATETMRRAAARKAGNATPRRPALAQARAKSKNPTPKHLDRSQP
jgi:DNA-binding GntR family transcriptional regulator